LKKKILGFGRPAGRPVGRPVKVEINYYGCEAAKMRDFPKFLGIISLFFLSNSMLTFNLREFDSANGCNMTTS
jgi:hypothetical protein